MLARVKVLFFATALVTLAFAGCLQQAAVDPSVDPNDGSVPALKTELPEGLLSGDKAYDYLYSFAMKIPFRSASHAGAEQSRSYLMTAMSDLGLEAVRQDYSGTGSNIMGIQNGTTNPDEWIVFTAHYDTASEADNVPLATVYGAWDDGAGVAALLELARSLSQREFNRTIVYLFTDEEEQGLVGSRNFVKEYAVREDIRIVANINMDPPALNYPCKDPDGTYLPVTILYNDKAQNQLNLYNASVQAADAIGLPENVRDFHTGGVPIAQVNGVGLSGSSDHASFWEADIPAIFLGGAVGKKVAIVSALSYGLHTAADTAQQMEARCGSPALLKAGFQTILDMAYGTLAIVDGMAAADLVLQDDTPMSQKVDRETPVVPGQVYLVGSSLKPAPGTDMTAYERFMTGLKNGSPVIDLPLRG